MYGFISRIFRENSITLGTYGGFTFYCSLRTEFPRLCKGILLNDPKYFKTLNPIHLLAPAAQVFTLSKSNETFVQSQQNSSEPWKKVPQVTESDINLVPREYPSFLTENYLEHRHLISI